MLLLRSIRRLLRALVLGGTVSLLVVGSVRAQAPSSTQAESASSQGVPEAARMVPLDPVAATRAYLDTVAGEARVRSDAYFEGGYWLLLWDFLLGVAVNLGLVATGLSRQMRELAERLSRFRPVRTFAYWTQYLVVTTILLFPMTAYAGFFREHQYGLSNQSFGAWLLDEAKDVGIDLVLGGFAVTAIYGIVRRLPRSWALWGAIAAIVLGIVGNLIAPVYIAPLFNDYTRLVEPVVSGRVLTLARSEGVSVDAVWVFDASRQTKRVSANVSGFAGTQRISLNDNLLNRCSLAEIEPVMAHEIGHYVLHHVYKGILFDSILTVIGFVLLKWGFERVARRGRSWGIRDVADPAGLPLAVAIFSTFAFLITPLTNSYTRMQEAEADLFGINASGQPDGDALVDLKLGEYRKLDPGWLEEIVFFDHPSGRNRILMAMQWKAEHPQASEESFRRAAEGDRERGWSPEFARTWARSHEPK